MEASPVEELMATHLRNAEDSFAAFKNSLLREVAANLETLEAFLKRELSKLTRKLASKLEDKYKKDVMGPLTFEFGLEPYVRKEYAQVQTALRHLAQRINSYLADFPSEVFQGNIARLESKDLLYHTNTIRHAEEDWWAVTSRQPLTFATLRVEDLSWSSTSWLALGVVPRSKEYSPSPQSFSEQGFLGLLFLNGTDLFTDKGFHAAKTLPKARPGAKALDSSRSASWTKEAAIKRDLAKGDTFVVEDVHRRLFVYRKEHGRNLGESFILEDEVNYYFYVAMKGALTVHYSATGIL